MTAHKAVEATCTEPGNTAYWECSVCKKFFSDEKGAAEIEKDSWIVPAKGHDLTEHKAVEATCTEPGNSAYWECSVCKKFFSDAEGKTEVSKNSWVIPAKGHDLTEHKALEPTCTEPGNTAYWECNECKKFFSDNKGETEIEKDSWVIPAKGHAWDEGVIVSPAKPDGTTMTGSSTGDVQSQSFNLYPRDGYPKTFAGYIDWVCAALESKPDNPNLERELETVRTTTEDSYNPDAMPFSMQIRFGLICSYADFVG